VIVCQCRVVNDRDIARAVGTGVSTVAQLCGSTGAGRDCGSCVFALKRVLCQHRDDLVSSDLEVADAAS
jgi:bacterioferritin-associated ferredoxin